VELEPELEKVSLHNSNLTIGPGPNQIYPSRLLSRSLDGASVNMGQHSGVVALMKREVPHVLGVHAVAHVLELGCADAVKDEELIDEMLTTSQEGYVHYAGSGKKRLTFETCCAYLGEEGRKLLSLHGIRWRESSYRGTINMLKTWRARCTDLLEEARLEAGMLLGPLSSPELFVKKTFRKKTPDGRGTDKIFKIKVLSYQGVQGGAEMFKCQYQTRVQEEESFSKADILGYLIEDSNKKDALMASSAGKLYYKMTKYSYVKTLHFWADLCSEGKILSKTLQRSGVLISDVTSGVEDCLTNVQKLSSSPGTWMKAFLTDFDAVEGRLDGIELSGIEEGERLYKDMLRSVCGRVRDHLSERFVSLLKNPILKAACIFEHVRWPSYETAKERLQSHGDDEIQTLLSHFGTVFDYAGGSRDSVLREWTRLKMEVMKDDNLRMLKYQELYERLFDQFSDKDNPRHFYNVLLLAAIVQTIAIDTSICERGFSLMNNLKTVRRSSMGKTLLRLLMVICSLGAAWKEPTQIPVTEIIEEWRAQSARGRYEGEAWSAQALADLQAESGSSNGGGGSGGGRGGGGGNPMPQPEDGRADVDNHTAGGLFSWLGRNQQQQPAGHAGTHLGTRMLDAV